MTALEQHVLTGIKADALATYLMGIGLMRIISEQKDPQLRCMWRAERFVLASGLPFEQLRSFFLNEYAPTPILAPWNLESGFFATKPPKLSELTGQRDSSHASCEATDDEQSEACEEDDADEEADAESDADAVGDPLLDDFAASSVPRFAALATAISTARKALPTVLLEAETTCRQARQEPLDRLQDERTAVSVAKSALDSAEQAVASIKDSIEAHKGAQKNAPKDARSREALDVLKTQLKQAQDKHKALKKEAQQAEQSLKKAVTRTNKDKETKARIARADETFRHIQKATKPQLIRDLRTQWCDAARQWIDAALALDQQGEAEFTPLFGSGGNDGRMEFTKNFRAHLATLFDTQSGNPKETAAVCFDAALLGTPSAVLEKKAVGMYFPGRAGGANMARGFGGDAGINPWEFVLMLEGAVAMVAGLSRKGDIAKARIASPFWVEAAAAGFGSASQHEKTARGEQWLPLWSRPLLYNEFTQLVRESRAQVGRNNATRATDMVRATARLGLARGIESLQRFCYLERNGQASLAVSTGRFHVSSRPRQQLLDEIAPWVDRLERDGRGKEAPERLRVASRRVSESLFHVCKEGAQGHPWRQLLVHLGAAEAVQMRSSKDGARRPLPRLSPLWLDAIDDGTESGRRALRLALALASQHLPHSTDAAHYRGSVRQHYLALSTIDSASPRYKLDSKGRLEHSCEYVCPGRDLVTDAIALLLRRSLWARSRRDNDEERPRQLPLQAVAGCEVSLGEVAAWLRGELVDASVLALVKPLLALDWRKFSAQPVALPAVADRPADPVQTLLRLAFLPYSIPVLREDRQSEGEVTVRLDPEPLRRLAAGDLPGALPFVIRRLSATGLRPVMRHAVASAEKARRLLATLAFPIARQEAGYAATVVCKPYKFSEPHKETFA